MFKYLGTIVKKWYFWLFLILGIIQVIISSKNYTYFLDIIFLLQIIIFIIMGTFLFSISFNLIGKIIKIDSKDVLKSTKKWYFSFILIIQILIILGNNNYEPIEVMFGGFIWIIFSSLFTSYFISEFNKKS